MKFEALCSHRMDDQQKPSTYFNVMIQNIPRELEEQVSQLCFQYQSLGVSENLNFKQTQLKYEPEVLSSSTTHCEAYFSIEPPSHFFDQIQELSPKIQWNVREEEVRDWLEEWKKSFVPFCLVDTYWVVPSWHSSPVSEAKTILMDPGMAFGTGTHATTKMAAYFVFQHLRSVKNKGIDVGQEIRFLDVGTGTGILLILASLLGVKQLYGSEIDFQAIQVAEDNFKKNHVLNVRLEGRSIEEWNGEWNEEWNGEWNSPQGKMNMILANIVDGVLIELLPSLDRFLSLDGHLFVTGILLERDEIFITEFLDRSPFQVHQRFEKEDWVGYWLVRKEFE